MRLQLVSSREGGVGSARRSLPRHLVVSRDGSNIIDLMARDVEKNGHRHGLFPERLPQSMNVRTWTTAVLDTCQRISRVCTDGQNRNMVHQYTMQGTTYLSCPPSSPWDIHSFTPSACLYIQISTFTSVTYLLSDMYKNVSNIKINRYEIFMNQYKNLHQSV